MMSRLKVFFSWSGAASKQAASDTASWLRGVIQAVEPFVSSDDIEKGTRWFQEISAQLEGTDVGIVVVTPENLKSEWIHFEAGGLAKLRDSYVCTLLVGVKPEDLQPPLSQFQATTIEEGDLRRLLVTINRKLGESALPDQVLQKSFEVWWPDLKRKLEIVTAAAFLPPRKARDSREILIELLELSRANSTALRLSSAPQVELQNEMRMVINAILGYAALLDDGVYGPLNEEQRHAVKRVSQAALQGLETLNNQAFGDSFSGVADVASATEDEQRE